MIVRLGQICSNGIVTLVILYFIVVVCRANSIEIEQFDGTIFRQLISSFYNSFFFFFLFIKIFLRIFVVEIPWLFFFFPLLPRGESHHRRGIMWPTRVESIRVTGLAHLIIPSNYYTPITLINFFLSFFLFCDETINSSAVKQRFVKRLKREKWMKVEGKLACRSWERLVTLKLA